MSKEALKEAVDVLGGQSAMATACGGNTKQGHVYYWLRSKHGLPPQHCERIELATLAKGKVIPKHRLRPDVFGDAAPSAPDGITHEAVAA